METREGMGPIVTMTVEGRIEFELNVFLLDHSMLRQVVSSSSGLIFGRGNRSLQSNDILLLYTRSDVLLPSPTVTDGFMSPLLEDGIHGAMSTYMLKRTRNADAWAEPSATMMNPKCLRRIEISTPSDQEQ